MARIFALGFWRGRNAYLRSTYNQLDFLVVVSSWALKAVSWSHYKEPIYPGEGLGFRVQDFAHYFTIRYSRCDA